MFMHTDGEMVGLVKLLLQIHENPSLDPWHTCKTKRNEQTKSGRATSAWNSSTGEEDTGGSLELNGQPV